MKSLFLFFLLALATVLSGTSCKKKQYLTGYYTYDEYKTLAKWDCFVDEDYKPNKKYLDSLRTLKNDESLFVKLFLGSYCGDSKKWVPRFYKLRPMLPISDIQIISVDTTKKDARGYWQEVKLEKIPTFVFYNPAGDEVGRIVEKPKGGLEKQLYRVFKNAE